MQGLRRRLRRKEDARAGTWIAAPKDAEIHVHFGIQGRGETKDYCAVFKGSHVGTVSRVPSLVRLSARECCPHGRQDLRPDDEVLRTTTPGKMADLHFDGEVFWASFGPPGNQQIYGLQVLYCQTE